MSEIHTHTHTHTHTPLLLVLSYRTSSTQSKVPLDSVIHETITACSARELLRGCPHALWRQNTREIERFLTVILPGCWAVPTVRGSQTQCESPAGGNDPHREGLHPLPRTEPPAGPAVILGADAQPHSSQGFIALPSRTPRKLRLLSFASYDWTLKSQKMIFFWGLMHKGYYIVGTTYYHDVCVWMTQILTRFVPQHGENRSWSSFISTCHQLNSCCSCTEGKQPQPTDGPRFNHYTGEIHKLLKAMEAT